MTRFSSVRVRTAILIASLLGALVPGGFRPATAADTVQPPAVGDEAADFELKTADGETVTLSKLVQTGPVVLIVLRGFPGYQCPVCNAQVAQFLSKARQFAAAKAHVVMVYPGPSDGLKRRADDFARGKTLPENFSLVLDPDFHFTSAYRLRWNAKNETAYPSTFVIDGDRQIRFAKISRTHGGRASVDEVLQALPKP